MKNRVHAPFSFYRDVTPWIPVCPINRHFYDITNIDIRVKWKPITSRGPFDSPWNMFIFGFYAPFYVALRDRIHFARFDSHGSRRADATHPAPKYRMISLRFPSIYSYRCGNSLNQFGSFVCQPGTASRLQWQASYYCREIR